MDVLDYDKLVADFECKLVTQLRGHGASADYLEMWVPDADPVKSVLNMVEAACAYGRSEIAIRLGPGAIAPGQARALVHEIGGLAMVEIADVPGGSTLIVVTGIGAGA